MAGAQHVGGVTRDDVARLAGVSSATVSRAYNRPAAVSEPKRQRIQEVAKTLGYQPDLNASGLRRKGGGAILLILPAPAVADNRESRVYRWFYGEALINAMAAVEGGSHSLRIGLWDRQEPVRRFLARHECAGVVFGLGTGDPTVRLAVRELGLPHVFCSQMKTLPGANLCYIDEVAGGALAARALRKTGRRRLAHLTGALAQNAVCAARWQGFREQVHRDGCEPVLIDGELGIAGGRLSALKLAPLVKRGKVDGLFVVNDLTAVGVMQGLLEAGVDIPGQLALVAYDNLPFRETAPVGMASIDVSLGRLYGTAVGLLAAILRGEIPEGEIRRQAVTPVLVAGPSLPL